MNDSVVIIGGNGYIGKQLIKKLITSDHYIIYSYDINNKTEKKSGVTYYKGDVFDLESLVSFIPSDSVVVYLVGKHYTTYSKNRNILINALLNSIRGCIESRIRHFIYVSNGAIYCSNVSINNEYSPVCSIGEYTYSSLIAEAEYLVRSRFESAHIDYSILRFGEVYGQDLYNRIRLNNVYLGDGTNYSSRIHISDATEILNKCITSKLKGNIFNVCDSLPITRQQFCEQIAFLVKDYVFSFLDDKKIIEDLKWSIYGLKTLSIQMDNRQIKDELSYVFKYPTYKEGLQSIFT